MTPWTRRLFAIIPAIFLFTGNGALADVISLPYFDGEINFVGENGSATPTGGTGIADATTIDFDNSKDIIVFGTSGDFSVIPNYTSATFFDFVFSPSTPADPLWQVMDPITETIYQFSVEVFTVVTQTDNILALQGTGYLSATGFSDTAGTWALSLDQAGSSVFGWSSTTAVVPEPGTLALLGIGLLGLGATRRRRTA